MHTGNGECYITSLFALELTQAYCSFFLFSHSLDCISCSYKEMCDAPVEPLVDHRPRSEIVPKRLTYSGGRGGIVTLLRTHTYTAYPPTHLTYWYSTVQQHTYTLCAGAFELADGICAKGWVPPHEAKYQSLVATLNAWRRGPVGCIVITRQLK